MSILQILRKQNNNIKKFIKKFLTYTILFLIHAATLFLELLTVEPTIAKPSLIVAPFAILVISLTYYVS